MLVHKTCFVQIHYMNFPLIVQSQSYKIHTQCELDFPDIYLHQTLHKNRLIFGALWTFTNTQNTQICRIWRKQNIFIRMHKVLAKSHI